MPRDTQAITLFSAKAATGLSQIMDVTDHENITIYIGTDGGGDAALTVKAVGSIASAAPAFTTQSVTDQFEFIQMVDLENNAAVDGDTGFVVATADDYRMFNVNVSALKWFALSVTARSAGEVTATAFVTTNS